MKTYRDMSEIQFQKAAKECGFIHEAMGYWKLAAPHDHISVYRFNAGKRRRTQLAYLIEQQKQAEKK